MKFRITTGVQGFLWSSSNKIETNDLVLPFTTHSLPKKGPNTEFFLVRIFSHSDSIRRDTEYLSVFSPNAGKYGQEKPPYLNTFHAVTLYHKLFFSFSFLCLGFYCGGAQGGRGKENLLYIYTAL